MTVFVENSEFEIIILFKRGKCFWKLYSYVDQSDRSIFEFKFMVSGRVDAFVS